MADVITYREAVAEGIAREMRRDPTVVCLGEDIGAAEGVFKTTTGLFREFGPDRVWDTPISEQAIVGAALGAAMTGLRPVAEIMFSDFLACCWDYVANEIPKVRYMTGGQVTVPLVIRTANGGGLGFGAQHSQAVENWVLTVPGVKIVAPSTPADVVGLMAAAIRSDDPVVVFEHKGLFASKGEPAPADHVVELGRAATVREGSDVTLVALASTVPMALTAAEQLARGGGLRGGAGPALPGPARRVGRARLGREDLAAGHGRGEPLPGRLGRDRRRARRRRGLRAARRPDPPGRRRVRAVALRGRPRGPGPAHRRVGGRRRTAAGRLLATARPR
ncbi:hypothetical protein KRR39_09385 [Nocardioides panacis]|uniref:Transketolase-like pyrimidine-binding domain-containing protein n=1 Tax=Nocardioides panacis TaxID=2849501 RepID=A0A975T1K7_9ACTN|nr:hypothetical protein [Nocardioides panacis]QWZ09914.1 hypothetical protein KRR39_09385 [Nocardioides panacis]